MSVNILTFRQLLALPEPPWLIQDILRTDQVGVVYGPPNGGKTFLVLDWGMSVAAGIPWLDSPVTQGPVLYMAGEGAFSLQKRATAWAHFHGCADVPAYFQTRPLDLRSEDVLEELRGALDDFAHPDDSDDRGNSAAQLAPVLVIVDTLSQFFGGGDENGSDMAQFVQACRSLSQSHQTAVLIVHHTNAGGARERGNSALRGNTDVMFGVKAIEKESKIIGLEITNDKHRDDPKQNALSIGLSNCQESLVVSGLIPKLLTRHVIVMTDENLKDLLKCALSVEDAEKEIVTLELWQNVSPLPVRKFYRCLHKLKDLKLVKAAGRGFYKLTDTGRETAYSLLTEDDLSVKNVNP